MNFKYGTDNKRYHTLNYHYKEKYNTRVFKVSLNAGFSCPNIKNGSGCIFCSNKGSGDFAGCVTDPLEVQFEKVKKSLNNKWPDTKYIAYFQANTNTYAPVSVLKEKFEKVLKIKNVVGLNIGTRSDSISKECLNYLIDLNKRCDLTIELGLQSMHNSTLKLINRGHTLYNFDNCVKKLRKNNINVVVHIINGLPYETKEMMLKTVKHLNELDIQGIKIHMLHILKNTKLETMYKENPFHILTKDEYINIVCDQLELLNENIVIHRLTGDGKKEDLIEPLWTLKKVSVLNDIDKELKRRNTHQGYYNDYLNMLRVIREKFIKYNDLIYINTCDRKSKEIFNINNIVKLNDNLLNKVSLILLDTKKDINTMLKYLNKKGIIILIGKHELSKKYNYNIYKFKNNSITIIKK